MKKVLLTGADGFIGSHLCELLLARNVQVRALSQYNSFNYWGWLEEIVPHPGLEVVCGAVRDPDFVKRISAGCDTVFHLAALIAIPYSYQAPGSYFETNVGGTLNICRAALDMGGIRVIHTSTSEVYGSAQYAPIDEKHPKQPQSPYSASKIAADALALSYYHSFDLPLTVARPFNTYGPRQSARAFIPTVISQIAAGLPCIEVGDLRPVRDLVFVRDLAAGFLAIADCPETIGYEINISTNKEISMGDLLHLIRKIMNSDADFISTPERMRPEKSEVRRLLGDYELMRSLTGWQPRTALEAGLTETCAWFSDGRNLAKYKPGLYNL